MQAESPAPRPQSPARRRRSINDICAIVADWRQSGLTQAAYAQRHGLAAKSLSRWSQLVTRRERAEKAQAAAFVALVPPAKHAAAVDDGETLRWQLPGEMGAVTGSASALGTVIATALNARLGGAG